MAIDRETINGLIKTIQDLYLSDGIPWMIGYSGGKDSTAALQLVWMAIEDLPSEQRKKSIHVMNTDIILSTDTEIDHDYYDLMKDFVGDEYTLEYCEETRSTSIQKGYFGNQ